MKKRIYRGPLVLIAVLFGILTVVSLLFLISFFVWSNGLSSSLSRLLLSDSRLPVNLTVFGRTGDSANSGTISARLDFFTAEGDLTGTVERSWSGWELKIDCILIGTDKGYLVFPFLAYTDETRRGRGVDLLHYYDRDGYPALYESAALREDERKTLRRLYSIVRTERWMPGLLGSLRHEIISVRSFEAGMQYSLFVTKDGELTLKGN